MKSYQRVLLSLAAVTCMSLPAAAAPDCPLQDAPFSIDSPLVDVLLSPQAKALFDAARKDHPKPIPASFVTTTSPTFAAIITLRSSTSLTGLSAEELVRLDTALRALPVTEADRAARCTRYDDERPQFALPSGKPRLLLFEKITGFRDGPSVDAGRAAFVDIAARKGWSIVTTDKGGAFAPDILNQFDVLIWNNVSGDVLTLSQRRAFQQWMEAGGAFVGIHGSAGDPVYFWDWYIDTLIGARFAGHPSAPQFQDARVVVEKHPIAAALPSEWVMNDEWYSFRSNPRANGASVIATLDEHTYSPQAPQGPNLRMGDHPIAWTRCVGKGRMFYSAIGHRPEAYAQPQHVALLEAAVAWAATNKLACSGK
jgi:uncharacterized protein